MKYQAQLTPWVIYQVSENEERIPLTRFRRRNDADAYLKHLSATRPNVELLVAFDVDSFIAPKKAAAAKKLATV
ncbi:MAG: hypothetical protein VKJ24_10915 [Synechococcales bacterium]|nr:hypothetical protein [Synechococcales bacterium]